MGSKRSWKQGSWNAEPFLACPYVNLLLPFQDCTTPVINVVNFCRSEVSDEMREEWEREKRDSEGQLKAKEEDLRLLKEFAASDSVTISGKRIVATCVPTEFPYLLHPSYKDAAILLLM